MVRLALDESRAAYDVLVHQRQVAINATPGASTSRSTQASATARASNSRARATSSPDTAPLAAPVAPAPTHGRNPPPLVGVGAPRFISFPKRKTQQTMRKIRAGLGPGKSALWREINIRHSNHRSHFTNTCCAGGCTTSDDPLPARL
jgi:hypothetical protein